MIPVKLYLKNFMSYGDNVPYLDFTSFQLACLCGNNGHGKSALIDAITWVLWGEGRKTSTEKKASDGLLKIGTTEMMVELVFDLEGDRFRVIRQYVKGNKTSKTTLEFEVFDEQIDNFTTLTQKSVSLTQAKINQFLRMTYEVFINSSALIQGRADEFAIKKASERKQLLADILGLYRYDRLSEKAREKYREANTRLKFIEEEKAKLEEELKQKKNISEKFKITKKELKNLNKEINATEKELAGARDKKNRLTVIKEKVNNIEEQLKTDSILLKEMGSEQSGLSEEIERLKSIVSEEENIKKSYEEHQRLLKEESLMIEKIHKMTQLRQKKNSLDSKIIQRKNEIYSEINIIKEQIKSIKDKLQTSLKIIEEREDIEKKHRELVDLEKKEKNLEESYMEQKNLEREKRKIEKIISEKENLLKIELGTQKNREIELEKKLSRTEELEKEIEEIRLKTDKIDELMNAKEKIVEKGQEKRSLIERIEEKIKDMEKETEEDRKRWKAIGKTRTGNCPLCEAPFDKERKLKTLDKIKKEAQIRKEKIDQLKSSIKKEEKEKNYLVLQHKKISEDLKNLEPEKSLLVRKEMELKECRKAEEKLEKLKDDIKNLQKKIAEKKYAEKELEELSKVEKKLREKDFNEKEIIDIRNKKEDLSPYRNLKIKLDMALEDKKELENKLPVLEKTLKEKEDSLNKEDFAFDLKEELKEIVKELDLLNYSGEEHNLLREKIKKLSKITTKKVLLDDAKKQLPVKEKKEEELIKNIDKTRQKLKNMKEEREEKIFLLSELPLIEEEIPQKEISLQGMRLRANDLTLEMGNLESLLENYKKRETTLKDLKEEMKSTNKDKKIYKILNKAFGKDGIQALIIQNCIPEIETEANKLLSRLTDNRIHLSLELLREKKSGGLKETLDIKISDEVGTRDYELYSGGEAFRTNFALRIALAKLLARRSGTKLRTLIIDEGFGTQDTEGLEQLVQVIQETSRDFDKIIVITHLETLKNLFPTRIEVNKSTYGSNFEIIHN